MSRRAPRYRVVHVSENRCRLEILADFGFIVAGEFWDYWCPDGGGHVREESLNRLGCTGTQICDGLEYTGETLEHGAGPLAYTIRKHARILVRREGADG